MKYVLLAGGVMKYILLAGDLIYTTGPDKYAGSFDSLEEANKAGLEIFDNNYCDWFAIIDPEKGVIATHGHWFGKKEEA